MLYRLMLLDPPDEGGCIEDQPLSLARGRPEWTTFRDLPGSRPHWGSNPSFDMMAGLQCSQQPRAVVDHGTGALSISSWSRFPCPLIKPGVRISRTELLRQRIGSQGPLLGPALPGVNARRGSSQGLFVELL